MLSTRISRFAVTIVVAALLVALVPVLPRTEAAGAGNIAYGQSVTGQITNKTYFELWQFQGARGDRVQIGMTGDGQLDPYLGLIDSASEEVLVEDDDSGGNSNAYIETTLDADGVYIIVATRYDFDAGTSQGQYQLTLAGGSGPQNVSATTTTSGAPQEISEGVFLMGDLAMGTPTSGSITASSYAQIYTIQLQQGTDFLLAMFADNSPLDCYLILADQDGNVLSEDNNSGNQVDGSKTDAFLRLTIPNTGTYLVGATRAGVDTGTSTGNYVLIAATPEEQNTAQQQNQGQNQTPAGVEQMSVIAAGQSANGMISSASFVHLYPYDGQADEQITITMTGSGGLDAYLGLIDPQQEVIAEDDDSGGGTDAQISIRLPESGTYLIVVTRNGIDEGTTQGSYTLTVTSGAPAAPTGVTGVGGFGGLPGRAFPVEGETFYLRGFGRSANPDKATPLEGFFQRAQDETLPGRSFDMGNNESFYLSGFGKSEDPSKATPLQSYLSDFLGQ